MKKIIFILMFISLMLTQLFAITESERLEIIKQNAVHRPTKIMQHNLERINIPNPFRFDLEKREKTTVKSYSIEPGNRDPIIVKINGEDQATIVQGDDFVITIYFSDGCSEANVSMWADMNDNQIWESTIDLLISDMQDEIIDNDLYDENPSVGIYQITFYGDDDGPNRCSNAGLFFVAEDTGGIDDAYLWIDSIVSDYSVSGSITPVVPNILIAAMSSEENMWMTTTDASGNYQNFVPIVENYMVMAFDPMGVLDGMFPNTVYTNVLINTHLTDYDFDFFSGNSTIEGTVLDENGAPVVGVTVYAEGQMPGSVWAETNSSGYYNLSVIEGWWEVGFDMDSLIPNYLRADHIDVYVEDGGTVTQDYLLYSTDSTIEGTAYLDDIPIAGLEIDSWSNIGSMEIKSGQNGSYVLHVASEANAMGGYCVNANIWDIPGVYVVESYNNVMSGSTGINFHVYTAQGGVEGHIYDSVTLLPAEDCWINAFDGTNWFDTGVDDDGYYQLPLPNGTYEVSAQGDMYYQQTVEDIVIEDVMVTQDFYLDPISFDGELWGIVYEEGTVNPIEGVQLCASCPPYWGYTNTNQDGYYHFDLPNGNYTLDAWHDNYYAVCIENIVINYNVAQQNIEMEPVIFEGSLEGYVYELDTVVPIPYANIQVGSATYWTDTQADMNGYYYFDLPNEIYSADCWMNGYFGQHVDNIEIADNAVIQNFYLEPDVEADDKEIEIIISLDQNYPNPFNPTTTISFSTTEHTESMELTIYNIKGQKVKSFQIHQLTNLPVYQVVWNGTNENNQPVSSGIYFYQLRIGNEIIDSKKMLLLK